MAEPVPPGGAGQGAGLAPLRAVIAALLAREAATGERARRSALMLADALLRDMEALGRVPRRPAQLAVLGPTQAGKSTVVNLLCGTACAGVSPLAGSTVHASAFALAPADPACGWLDGGLGGFERCPAERLAAARLDCYGLAVLPAPRRGGGLGADTVVWDTPDFDSVRAAEYSRAVLEVAALADLLVLVLSKEKYSDGTVWQAVAMLAPLGRPMLICLNKVEPAAEALLRASLAERLREFHPQPGAVPVVVLPYRPGGETLAALAGDADAAGLVATLAERLVALPRERRIDGVRAYLRAGWPGWVAPLRDELAAGERWEAMAAEAVAAALLSYRDEFLDHDERFDSFRRALLEVLRLLEIPAIAGSAGRLRQLLTWPARRLGAVWRGPAAAGGSGPGGEERVLRELLDELVTTLARDVLRQADPAAPGARFWQALDRRLAEHREALEARFAAAVAAHVADFGAHIEASARRLLEALQGNPALLNTLRAARASADLGGVLLAIKTGGLGVNDLVIAPAMLSLTSLLTEGALGGYMRQEAARLRRQQFEALRRTVFDGCVVPALAELAAAGDTVGPPGFDAALLATAEAALGGNGA